MWQGNFYAREPRMLQGSYNLQARRDDGRDPKILSCIRGVTNTCRTLCRDGDEDCEPACLSTLKYCTDEQTPCEECSDRCKWERQQCQLEHCPTCEEDPDGEECVECSVPCHELERDCAEENCRPICSPAARSRVATLRNIVAPKPVLSAAHRTVQSCGCRSRKALLDFSCRPDGPVRPAGYRQAGLYRIPRYVDVVGGVFDQHGFYATTLQPTCN